MIEEGNLLARIERLERGNRIMKGAFIAMALLAAALFLVTRFESGRRLVAEELVITDDAGNVVAKLGSAHHRTCLELDGSAELTKAALCADKTYGAFLNLTSRDPAGRAYLSAGERVPEGGYMVPALLVEGEAGKGMLSFHAGTETELVFGRGVEENAVMLSGGRDRPTLKVWGAGGKSLWAAP
jgi:hypothetical protein